MSRGLGGADEEKECCGGRSEGFYLGGMLPMLLGSCGQLHRRQMAHGWSGQRASSRSPPASHASTLLLALAGQPSPKPRALDMPQVL